MTLVKSKRPYRGANVVTAKEKKNSIEAKLLCSHVKEQAENCILRQKAIFLHYCSQLVL